MAGCGRDAPTRKGPGGDDETRFDDRLHLGSSAMKTARLCIGILLLMGLAAGIGWAFVPEPELRAYGPVEGTVRYRGRPVAGGRIFFVEEGRDRWQATYAPIAPDGSFRCPPYWMADRSTRRRYRIFVELLEPEEPRPLRPAGHAAGSGQSGGSLVPVSNPDQETRPADRVAPAAMERPGPADPKRPPIRSPRHRFSSPTTTDLAVWLGDEPARVDIDLED
jgi:hypothetical protein